MERRRGGTGRNRDMEAVIRIYVRKKNLLSKKGRKKDFISFKSECFSSKRQMVTDFGESVDKDKPMILG